jgi:tricarballylate dehydrogenase
MAGNILRRGYIAGIGMTIGTVFGRIAGQQSAQSVRSNPYVQSVRSVRLQ